MIDVVPSYLGNFVRYHIGGKPFDLLVEQAQAGRVALFRMGAHQLHTQANAQHRLCQGADEPVELAFAQVGHGRRCFPYPGENHPVGTAYRIEIIGHNGLDPYPLQGE